MRLKTVVYQQRKPIWTLERTLNVLMVFLTIAIWVWLWCAAWGLQCNGIPL